MQASKLYSLFILNFHKMSTNMLLCIVCDAQISKKNMMRHMLIHKPVGDPEKCSFKDCRWLTNIVVVVVAGRDIFDDDDNDNDNDNDDDDGAKV
jgi:hypothetical protein